MSRIDARPKTIRELLSGVKYSVDYYQREYKWQAKNIEELLQDLEAKFMDEYSPQHERWQVRNYSPYFLGSIVLCEERGEKYIIDGQQRLTSLTLLLIYLHHRQQGSGGGVDVSPLIFSERYGKKSYNLNVPERRECIDSLYSGKPFDATNGSESVRNVVGRYEDIVNNFPDSLSERPLPFFVDWLLDNVTLVEITAYTDDDAYTIFETMNDRGLSLSPTDMLKGYLLANINDPEEKAQANTLWRQRLSQLIEFGKEEEADFFKAWLRAKYAATIRERAKGATNKDFERIGTTFHKWVRDERERIGLETSSDFNQFVHTEYAQFSQHYVRILRASREYIPGFEYVFFNAYNNFTLQFPLILAPILATDAVETVDPKIRLVSGFLDIYIARRVWNFRTLGYSSIVYTMFNLLKEIRDKSVPELAGLLHDRVVNMPETFDTPAACQFRLHGMNKRYVHFILARITAHIEGQAGIATSFQKYVDRYVKKPFEVEHIWADKFDRHRDEFSDPTAFSEFRNRIGGLLLLPRGFNQSFGDLPYDEKLKPYYGQNLLAQSLNDQCYQKNPGFLSYLNRSRLPFRAHPQFRKEDLEERQELYRQIAKEIWNPDRFERELSS